MEKRSRDRKEKDNSRVDHLHMPKDHMDALYNSKNRLVKFVHNNRLDTIVKKVEFRKNMKVLDAGCGECHLLERIDRKVKGLDLHGIDITPVAIESGKKRLPAANIELGDLSRTTFTDGTFDIVICTQVLEHIHEYDRIIKELWRITKTGGHLVITFPNERLWTISRFILRKRPAKVPDHVNSFRPGIISASVGKKAIITRGLPFGFPFPASLGYIMVFRKE